MNNRNPHLRIQLHLLKAHAASNMNRDDTGRPKELVFGGANRLRLSSQSVKRALRMGQNFDAFRQLAAEKYKATRLLRTTMIPTVVVEALEAQGLVFATPAERKKVATAVAGLFKKEVKPAATGGTGKKAKSAPAAGADDQDEETDDSLAKSQLLALSEEEIDEIVTCLLKASKPPVNPDTPDAPVKLSTDWAAKAISEFRATRQKRASRGDLSPEIQLFGRMVTNDIYADVDSPLQVAHAFTTHEVKIERDYWTGVDDLKQMTDQQGSGMLDVRRYASGVFYHYACLDVDLLTENLRKAFSDLDAAAVADLAIEMIETFIQAYLTENPTGLQNSFASHAYAQAVMAEVGTTCPYSAADAFESAVVPEYGKSGHLEGSKARLVAWEKARQDLYGAEAFGQMYTAGLPNSTRNVPTVVSEVLAAAKARVQEILAPNAQEVA